MTFNRLGEGLQGTDAPAMLGGSWPGGFVGVGQGSALLGPPDQDQRYLLMVPDRVVLGTAPTTVSTF
jgi:hypothetical protein